MKQKLLFIFLFFFISQPSVFSEPGTYSIISKSNPDIMVLSSKVFSWSEKSRYVYDDTRLEGFPIKEKFQNDIKNKLTSNGFVYSESLDNSSILVGYVIALESSLSDLDINNLYGINPGFINKDKEKLSDDYEKGTIIIDIIEARTNRLVWRGALQGMAEFGISESERETRLKSAVDSLLSEFIRIYGQGKK